MAESSFSDSDIAETRERTLTEKGFEMFEHRRTMFVAKLERHWSIVQLLLKEVDYTADLSNYDSDIHMKYENFRKILLEYRSYLLETRTEASTELAKGLDLYDKECEDVVATVLNRISRCKLKLDKDDKRSVRSHSVRSHSVRSRRSVSSTSSSVAAKAKYAAAQARMVVSRMELDLKRKQAMLQEKKTVTLAKAEREEKEIEADLCLLNDEKKMAEAAAENEVYETITECHTDILRNSLDNNRDNFEQNSRDRTEQYVKEHLISASPDVTREEHKNVVNDITVQNSLNNNVDVPINHIVNQSAVLGAEFSRFLVKKDLLMTRFTKFQDDPVMYTVWKNTFQILTQELGVTTNEELDLLIKWLGPESSKQAMNLRAANSHDPEGGKRKIWERLDERYGAPELIESKLQSKIVNFPKVTAKDYKKLYDLSDILSEIESMKDNVQYSTLLACYDSSLGVNTILAKLPVFMQNKWFERARKYKVSHNMSYPPFRYFVIFIKEMCSLLNDPSFVVDSSLQRVSTEESHPRKQDRNTYLTARKTDVDTKDQSFCPIHHWAHTHTLDTCRGFLKMTIEDKKKYLKEKRICFRCCRSDKHLIKDCTVTVKCDVCSSIKHSTAMHDNRYTPNNNVTAKCLQLCGCETASTSCAKIVSVTVCHKDNPSDKMRVYAIIDDQANRSLGTSELFDRFDNFSFEQHEYTLSSCNGKMKTCGRLSRDLVIGANGNEFHIPSVTECPDIPDNREEIPTPDIALRFNHLRSIADEIPPLSDAPLALLIGRDLPEAHHVLDQIVGTEGPYAQRLHLGWVLVGETCLGSSHTPPVVRVKKTFIRDGHLSIFPPCESYRNVKDNYDEIFLRRQDDNEKGLSLDDRKFLKIMDKNMAKDEKGNWTAPLPFVERAEENLPNNREIVFKRAMYLDSSLKKNPTKARHFVEFMDKVLQSNAAEVAPPLTTENVWYLPIFGVYHPRKPDKIRGVFDSSAVCKGVSLNKVLLLGPNLVNRLLAVLLRFRQDRYAIMADIEQMFYSFLVRQDHRDFLRFFWYKNNNPSEQLIEYRMCAHVFGNSPSPAVATYGLRRTVEEAEDDVQEFVNNNFYVDDGLTSLLDPDKAISLMRRTQASLQTANLRLHKIASNCKDVMKAFPEDDLQNNLKTLNLETEDLPMNQTLGVSWDLNTDCFRFDIKLEPKPYTRRGLLSTLNSVYDPLGFASPVVLCGKMLLREIATGYDWDEPLDTRFEEQWKSWQASLLLLQDVTIPRMYAAQSLSTAVSPELHIFSDASEKAISAVAYIRTLDGNSVSSVGFVMGKSKLAPTHGHTIPRLELCAAVLASEIGNTITAALKINFQVVKFYSDSRITLGYITNSTRRFYNYVANRVQRILHLTRAEQWSYIYTKDNPADIGSRGCSSPDKLKNWLDGPTILKSIHEETNEDYQLISPDDDKEVRHDVTVHKTTVTRILSEKFEYFSNWKRLVKTFMLLKRAMRNFKTRCFTDSADIGTPTVNLLKETERFILKLSQQMSFCEEIKCLGESKPVKRDSPISSLNPYLDEEGIMRVGGRLNQGSLTVELSNPIVLSSKCHTSTLLVRHFHESCNHQGRHLTEGSLRYHGYWIVGAKRLVSSLLYKCVTCRKLRGKTEHQVMADLPEDRLTPGPPFSYVGVDVFGPWTIVSRRTRGGMAQSKRWAVLFTCLTTRAVHIEVIEEMSSSSFINALRRFVSLRGNVKEFRSDRGTNFVGAIEDLKINAINVEDEPVTHYLSDSRVIWRFNAPHSSHMGGVWERMIGMSRRILDGLLLKATASHLTHEVLVTLMAEVVAIMNSRPIAPITSDAESPVILTPATLLNQKIDGDPSVSFDLNQRDMYTKHWKMVQVLSDKFWKQWRDCYLQTLQSRRKWKTVQQCIENGMVVLLKDKCLPRNEWPVGVVMNVIPSDSDKLVRKAEVRICKKGSCNTLTRPITDMIVLVD